MALLQISEPGATPDPHQRRIAVGIDLGTTHSLVAAVRHGTPECLPDEAGRVLLPSVVFYGGGHGHRIGLSALAHQLDDPENTVASVKRLMGRKLVDIQAPEKLPYRLIEPSELGSVCLQTREGLKSPVEVSAEILATLRQRAEDTFDQEIFGAVVTVPAYFDDAQRQATKDAAQLAGLNVLRLLNEPTAAAIAYGLDQGIEGLYAVYDLGGGTFDVSLLRLNRGIFEVVATGGDSALGGDDIDHALADWLQTTASLKVTSPSDRRALLVAARQAKEGLSSQSAVNVQVQAVAQEITRQDLTQVAKPWVDRTLQILRKVLRDAKVALDQVQGIVMVGGSTRMPAVQEAVAAFFGRPLLTNLNPDEVVALGAAIQADQLAGNGFGGGVLLLDVLPLSLGLETMGGLTERVIERNTPIPAAHAQEFTTFQDGQTAMSIHVVQGERELVKDCRSLARFELKGIPPMVAGAAKVRVTFQVDADGLLNVFARELQSNVEASIVVKPSYGLGDEEVARLLKEGFAWARQDMQIRALQEARINAERLVAATRSALQADGDLLLEEERRIIDRLLQATETIKQDEKDPAVIENATEALAQGTENFAALRMNRGIQRALAGQKVDEV